jgi:hypothetical protein
MASIALNYLLGRTLAERTGVVDEGSKNLVAVVMIGLDLSPIGVLLARQIALQRVPPPAAAPNALPPPGKDSAAASAGGAGADASLTSPKVKS